MRFLLILIVALGLLAGLSYFSFVNEHSVLTQIETSIASSEEIEDGPEAESEPAPSPDSDVDEDTPSGSFFSFGARNDGVAPFDIAGDADEIGFNCPFGIEALEPGRIAVLDPVADRILIYSLADDRIVDIAPLQRSEGYDVIAAAAYEGDLFIGERSLTGRDEMLRRFTFAEEAGVREARVASVDQLPAAVIEKLERRGYTVSSGARTAQAEEGDEIVRARPDTGSVSTVAESGDVISVDYEINDERFLQLTRRLSSGETMEVTIHARRPIAVVRVAQINQNGDIYLSITEELRRLRVYRSDETIIRVPADATEDIQLFYVPRSRVCTPRQNTTILSTGEVVSIFVRRNDVSLVKLRPKGQWQWRVRTARDTSGVFLTEQFRGKLKPADKLAAKYPDFAASVPPKPPLPRRQDEADGSGASEAEPAVAPEGGEGTQAGDASITNVPDATAATTATGEQDVDAPSPEAAQSEDADDLTSVVADATSAYAAALEDAFIRVPAGESIDRRSVVHNACTYLNLRYTMGQKNYEPETAFHYGQQSTVTSPCASRGNHNLAFWSRPSRLSGRVGEEITSVPYVWAGSDWPWQFVEKIAAGRPAGDVCTKIIIYDAKSAVNAIYAAGVDCSGFVSRAWGGNARYTTRSIPGASTEIAFEDLQPGDVLNKAGNHVVMFLFWRGPGEMEIIEATTNSACGGVCSRTRKIEEFQGYTAYRPNHIEESSNLSAAEVEQICLNATVAALE